MVGVSRIIFLDVDGTIVGAGHEVKDSTVEAIRQARDAGHLVYLCTGRSAADIHPRAREAGVDGEITNGGAFGTSGGTRVIARQMPRDAVDRMLAFFTAHDVGYFLQSDTDVYVTAPMRRAVESYFAAAGPDEHSPLDFTHVKDAAEADLNTLAKATFLSPQTGILEQAQSELGPDFHIVPGSVQLPGGSDGEINMAGVTKGSAIELMLAYLGRDAADAIGIGDSWNDVEMFEVCGHSVAMGNAVPALKELADDVTTDVLDDGIWNAFVRLGLISSAA